MATIDNNTVGSVSPYQPTFPLTYYLSESFDNYYTFVSAGPPAVTFGGYTNTYQVNFLTDGTAFAMYTPPIDATLYTNRWTLNYLLCFSEGGTYQLGYRTTVGGDRGNLTVTLIDQLTLTTQTGSKSMLSGSTEGQYFYFNFNLLANTPYKLELNVLTTSSGNWYHIGEYVTITKV